MAQVVLEWDKGSTIISGVSSSLRSRSRSSYVSFSLVSKNYINQCFWKCYLLHNCIARLQFVDVLMYKDPLWVVHLIRAKFGHFR